jgi:hypothetical protein
MYVELLIRFEHEMALDKSKVMYVHLPFSWLARHTSSPGDTKTEQYAQFTKVAW